MATDCSIRNAGLAAAAWLVGTAILFGCSRGEYEKPAKTEEPTPAAAAPKAEEPTPVPTAPEATPSSPSEGKTEEAEPTPTAEPAAAAPAAATATQEAASSESRTQHEREATRGLQLVGLVRGGASPAALIEYEGAQEMFREGDEVFGRGVVERVSDDAVTIRAGTERFALRLPAVAPAALPPAPEVVEAPPPTVREEGPSPIREALRRRDAERGFGSFARLLAEAKAEPVEVAGGRGIRVNQVAPGSFLSELGLKSGDILQKIGGVALTDPEKLPDLSGSAAAEAVTVTFVRGDVGLTLSRPIR
jgi:type II secretory pathway component PulC